MRLLFLCGRNRLRSPTAEQVFTGIPGIEVSSAGLNPEADNPVCGESLAWADIIFVMEESQRTRLTATFSSALRGKRIVCLDIPDNYAYMDPQLIQLLWQRVPRSVSGLSAARPRTGTGPPRTTQPTEPA